MFRLLFFVLLIAAAGFAFAWLADTPGTIVMTVAGQQITVSLMVAVVTIAAIVVAVMLTWWLIRVIITSPQRMQRFFRARRRDRGYQSLSTGIIAAGAGDSVTARRMLKQAGGLLDSTSEPLIELLNAQTSLVEGNHEDARGKFEAMLSDPELRILGLRGLYMEAKRLGDRDAAKHYAEKAAELAPHLGWAGAAALELKTASGDWDGAIRLLDSQKNAKQVSRDAARRKRAVLLTALAMEQLEKDPVASKSAALEAHKLAPGFAPAAVTAAQASFRLNDMRRGIGVLEAAWRKQPHPELALAYINARHGDSTLDRFKRARKLEALKPNNTESSMIVAQMALEAGEYEDARKAVAAVLRNEPREGAFMLMADIEDAETGDQGKVREWLARAVRAPRDPTWTADGYVSEHWAPISPVTGRLDAFEWKVPVERLGPVVENDLDPMVPGISVMRGPEADTTGAAILDHEDKPSTPNAQANQPQEDDGGLYGKSPAEGEVLMPDPDTGKQKSPPGPPEEKAREKAPAPDTRAAPAKPAEPVAQEKLAEPPKPAAVKPEPAKSESARPRAKDDGEKQPPIPDDPGIADEEETTEPSRRFRLF